MLKKCVFDFKKLDFLGYCVSIDGIQIDPQKVHASALPTVPP